MCAIDLPSGTAADAVGSMLERGFLVNNTSPRTLRFLPPLVITGDELNRVLSALRDVLTD
jgi:acetylornithine aminotransferase